MFFSAQISAFQLKPNQDKSITDKRLFISYHPNGKIKQKGYQGNYSGYGISTGMSLGTWYIYDKNGKLIETVYYHNDKPTKAYILKKTYYPNGNVKSIKRFNNYQLYQAEIDSIGTWSYFDERGNLIRIEKYR
ncbi:toxin-antitoxin system YwqK family antitoxin [Pedobacter duraquae]|uniref:MORN repeat protein n=1 Tax=Pedobacter duraquae TaxID=425511 RepID=A0A4R6IG17_9SPHI|nr:hypothetical protein [Pedobacter duraquae]TDO20701.1 MORN repeat protein [Pedobacter duraquae]